jgi:signal transduction histidine kinase
MMLSAARGVDPLLGDGNRERSLVDTVRALYAYIGTTLLGNLLGGVLLVPLLYNVAPQAQLAGWSVAFLAVWGYRAWLGWRYRVAPPPDEPGTRAWLMRWNVGALASGAVWGAAAWAFFGLGQAQHQLALMLIVNSICYGAIPLLAAQRGVFVAFVVLAFGPAIAAVALHPSAGSWPLAGLMMVIFAMAIVLGRSFSNMFEDMVELRVRTFRLLEQLRDEKAAAESARRAAESANRAKTRFFAAASHDLRQPLHALGLFAEALRGKSRDTEVAQLVNSINGSVDALDGLFSELLDITKIDAGGVAPKPVDFRLDDLMRRLKLHFEPIAFEKGLSLRLRGGAQVARADPVLVERVLRNLTSNAIRYTDDGTVLVSARRRGSRLLLQVWDSGPGIHPRDQERIFDEFAQLTETSASLAPHQRKGLGLGLAIVRRLAKLMEAPLTLRSVPGRGSVFTLDLPVGDTPPPDAPGATARLSPNLTLHGRRIVVVEDDEAVRQGLQVLLAGWGAALEMFDSVQACEAWCAALPPESAAPHLAIVDYQLESGRTGLEALSALRTRFGAALPAIVVTGSVLGGHEQEAQAHDAHLMLKPVVPGKLRAMIAFKLGLR